MEEIYSVTRPISTKKRYQKLRKILEQCNAEFYQEVKEYLEIEIIVPDLRKYFDDNQREEGE